MFSFPYLNLSSIIRVRYRSLHFGQVLADALEPAQRSRRGQHFAGFQQRLESGEDHRPAAIELIVGALAQLVMGDCEPTGIADRHDLPGYPRRALGLDVFAPGGAKALHQPTRRIDLEILTLENQVTVATALIARTVCPVRRDDGAESIFAAHLGIGDGVPETLGRRLDVDLENLLHRLL